MLMLRMMKTMTMMQMIRMMMMTKTIYLGKREISRVMGLLRMSHRRMVMVQVKKKKKRKKKKKKKKMMMTVMMVMRRGKKRMRMRRMRMRIRRRTLLSHLPRGGNEGKKFLTIFIFSFWFPFLGRCWLRLLLHRILDTFVRTLGL